MLGWNVTRPVDLIKGIIVSDTTIQFINWDKYNKRQKDIKRPFWFAMSNELFMDPFYAELNDQERQAFIWLLCEASRQNKYGEVEISSRIFVQITGYKKSILLNTIDKLLKSGRAAGSRQDHGRIATATRQNRTEQDRTEQDRTLCSAIEKNSISHPEAYGAVVHVFESREVAPEITATWVDAFPDPGWVVAEVHKALAWEGANSTRKKKNFGRFMTNWLTRGWDRRITTAPTKNYAERRYEANKNALEIALAREAAKNEK